MLTWHCRSRWPALIVDLVFGFGLLFCRFQEKWGLLGLLYFLLVFDFLGYDSRLFHFLIRFHWPGHFSLNAIVCLLLVVHSIWPLFPVLWSWSRNFLSWNLILQMMDWIHSTLSYWHHLPPSGLDRYQDLFRNSLLYSLFLRDWRPLSFWHLVPNLHAYHPIDSIVSSVSHEKHLGRHHIQGDLVHPSLLMVWGWPV